MMRSRTIGAVLGLLGSAAPLAAQPPQPSERVTLRYDLLDPQWLDRAVSWLTAHGAHPYLLVEGWEVPDVRIRFPDQQALQRLDDPPVFVHRGLAGPARLFDLVEQPDDAQRPSTIVRQTDTTRSQTPIELDRPRFE